MQTSANIKKVPVNFVVKKKKKLNLDDEPQENLEEKIRAEIESELEEKISQASKEADDILQKAKFEYDEIIKVANAEKEDIIKNSNEEAKNIEKEAYEKGYDEGRSNGYEDGYKEAYDDNIEKAKQESKEIIDEAENILKNAHNSVALYMKSNKNNIIEMILSISEKVLRERFKDVSSINSLVNSVIEEYELKNNFVIRVNPLYKENILQEVDILKKTKKIDSEVFVLEDYNIDEGNVQIDTENGKIMLGIDSILQKVKEELV